MNKILQGNSYEVIKSIPDNSIDYIIFSPPYDNLRDYNNFPLFDKTNREILGKECYRILKNNSICTVIIQDQTIKGKKTGTSFRLPVEWIDLGWGLFETTIYSRNGVPGAFWNKRFRVDHEYIHHFIKGESPHYFNKDHMKIPTKNPGKKMKCNKRQKNGKTDKGEYFICSDTKCCGTIWKYSSSSIEHNEVKKQHPATYPDKLCSDCINCFSAPSELVFDPFMGSGTTAVMAAQNNRSYLGIEYSEDYIKIIEERIKKEVNCSLWEKL